MGCLGWVALIVALFAWDHRVALVGLAHREAESRFYDALTEAYPERRLPAWEWIGPTSAGTAGSVAPETIKVQLR